MNTYFPQVSYCLYRVCLFLCIFSSHINVKFDDFHLKYTLLLHVYIFVSPYRKLKHAMFSLRTVDHTEYWPCYQMRYL